MATVSGVAGALHRTGPTGSGPWERRFVITVLHDNGDTSHHPWTGGGDLSDDEAEKLKDEAVAVLRSWLNRGASFCGEPMVSAVFLGAHIALRPDRYV
jgi:hypothetical protein